jgi:hypothetical protein
MEWCKGERRMFERWMSVPTERMYHGTDAGFGLEFTEMAVVRHAVGVEQMPVLKITSVEKITLVNVCCVRRVERVL